MVAQGNALGKMIQKCVLVLKGQHKRAPLFCPLQGKCPHDHCTQGVALGYDCHCAFSATKPAFHFLAGALFCRASNFVRLFRASISRRDVHLGSGRLSASCNPFDYRCTSCVTSNTIASRVTHRNSSCAFATSDNGRTVTRHA